MNIISSFSPISAQASPATTKRHINNFASQLYLFEKIVSAGRRYTIAIINVIAQATSLANATTARETK